MKRILSATALAVCLSFVSIAFSQVFTEMTLANDFGVTGQNRGIAIADFNNDGLEDIYVTSLSGRNLLYQNKGNFQFEEVADQYRVNSPRATNAAVWFDMDNDGDQDLFLANSFQPNVLYRNDGDRFKDVSYDFGVRTSSNPKSVLVVDYDNDGYLDLYLAQIFDQNILFRNEGGKRFTDVTEVVGIDDRGRSLGAVFVDYDLDGDQDLFQTRDGEDVNLFYENESGFFREVASELDLDFVGMGMGTDVADLNGDLYPDFYLTNLYENKLYLSQPSGMFQEISQRAGVDDIGMGWSTFFFDCNNDGLKDIYLANDSRFGVNGISPIANRLFINRGDLSFYSQTYEGAEQNIYGTFGAAAADFDLDGQIDIAVANNGVNDGNQLFRNTSNAANHITFQFTGVQSNRDAIGTRVVLYAGEKRATDFVRAGSGYASQGSKRLHFGLGEIEVVDSLEIFWPSGLRQLIVKPGINQVHSVEEGKVLLVAGEVVWTEPAFPTQADDVKVFFNAAEGNAALKGFTGQVFAHTGVITSKSNNPTDWQHVIGNWGTFDTRVLMTRESEDVYSISYNIQDFYGIDPGEEVFQMAFVFRNVDGSIVGRNTDGSDIFTEVFPPSDSLFISINAPANETIVVEGDSMAVDLRTSQSARIVIRDNGSEIFNDSTDQVQFQFLPSGAGDHTLSIIATTAEDSTSLELPFLVLGNQATQNPPSGIRDGLNYAGENYVFQLFAPGKQHVFLLCPLNNFSIDLDFRMKQSEDGNSFWLEIPKSQFTAETHAYQYLVDGEIRIADPYSEVVLDPSHDPFLDPAVLADLPDYPTNAGGIVTAFDPEPVAYPWQIDNFSKPAKTDLVIYELLLRDFLEDHSYNSLLDTLNYLAKLGVNAIELMPIQEFEGNISWGYNPSFHMAVDKYYGSREQLKAFIDAAHARGIAVILDVVYNHTFSQGPLAQLYWDPVNFRPAEDNPWLNVEAKHPFNVGYDFNHEYEGTKNWVKRTLQHWIEDFRFDGFRFDLSKGLTQTFSGTNAGFMSQYDASRIAILKDYANYIWSLDSSSYVILEHFAENREEKELANAGMMLWGNNNFQFGEAAMGYRSDLEFADYTVKEWNDPHLIAYMESHDEERLMYKIPRFGEQEGNYSTRDFSTALERVAAASTIFYTIPGPKMLWQFGELGYDFSINRCSNGSISEDCRLVEKPIRWDFLNDPDRKKLMDISAALIHLKTNYPTFSTRDFTFADGNFFVKTVHLNHPEMDAMSIANFRVTASNVNPKFQYTGTWYEYFSGDSLEVTNVNDRIDLAPGEYRIYTSQRIQPPGGFITTSTSGISEQFFEVFPNPVRLGEELILRREFQKPVSQVKLISLTGQKIEMKFEQEIGLIQLEIPSKLAPGMYVVQVELNGEFIHSKILVE